MADNSFQSLRVTGRTSPVQSTSADAGLYGASTIAKWFVAYANVDEADLSNMKLQKLLYYAQGHFLALRGVLLFDDPIEAWSHGPVVPDVYHEYKKFENRDLELDAADPFDWDDIDPETTQFLLDIWNSYGGFAAWKLRDMTHSESPWVETFEETVRHKVITIEVMRSFFSRISTASR